ncbi:hypothetical protein ScPMuIL_016780 [Solemya velum]
MYMDEKCRPCSLPPSPKSTAVYAFSEDTHTQTITVASISAVYAFSEDTHTQTITVDGVLRTVCCHWNRDWHFGPVWGALRLRNNGYEGVLVAIGDEVPQDQAVVDQLKEILTEASADLSQATNHRAYIRDVTIVLPATWRLNASDTACRCCSTSPRDTAQVVVDLPNPVYGDNPYTLQPGLCGDPGEYIHLTPGYVVNKQSSERTWGRRGRLFVHEWGHLRWGLFDEFPAPGDPAFYFHDGRLEAVRCNKNIRGRIHRRDDRGRCRINPRTGKISADCVFSPDASETTARASMMYLNYLPTVHEFCDKTGDPLTDHNQLSPSRQNILCNGQSAWEVMRGHSDFRNGMNPSTDGDRSTTPKFCVVSHSTARRRVMVLDVSGSMKGDRLQLMRQASNLYIRYVIENKSVLGIVEFSEAATTTVLLTEVTSTNVRENITGMLPKKTKGGTSIGAGLKKAMQMLVAGGREGGQMLLISDGEENHAPYIKDVIDSVVNSKIRVDTIAFSQQADRKLGSIAAATGGRNYFFSTTKPSTGLVDALGQSVVSTRRFNPGDEPLMIHSSAVSINRGSSSRGVFFIDSTIGRETVITFSYSNPIAVELTSPSGSKIQQHSPQYQDDTNFKMITIKVTSTAESGSWTYVITAHSQSTVTVTAQSKPKSAADVIYVTSWLSRDNVSFTSSSPMLQIYARVNRGRSAVTSASVMAKLEGPSGRPVILALKDNGVGCDNRRGDGLYCAYILPADIDDNGRFGVKVQVLNSGGGARLSARRQGSAAAVIGDIGQDSRAEDVREEETVEQFERSGQAGVVMVGNRPHNPPADLIPPSRVTDFRLRLLDSELHKAVFAWTAVGDDMDRGNASRYTLSMAHALDQTSGQWTQNISSSTPAGDEVEVTISLPDISGSQTLYAGVTASDDSGNVGETSNTVTVPCDV